VHALLCGVASILDGLDVLMNGSVGSDTLGVHLGDEISFCERCWRLRTACVYLQVTWSKSFLLLKLWNEFICPFVEGVNF
jgi:hypothetical protein